MDPRDTLLCLSSSFHCAAPLALIEIVHLFHNVVFLHDSNSCKCGGVRGMSHMSRIFPGVDDVDVITITMMILPY
jgi:hypothetical protein